MAGDDRARTVLYERLDKALGNDAADTLMGYLPPVGWADVATKSDLALLQSDLRRIEARFPELEARLEAKFERALRQAVLALVMVMIAAVGAAVGITQLLSG